MFGSVAYQHVLYQRRKKLDDKEKHIILVGFRSTSGYKLYDIANRRTVISRGVDFDEIKEVHQPITGH